MRLRLPSMPTHASQCLGSCVMSLAPKGRSYALVRSRCLQGREVSIPRRLTNYPNRRLHLSLAVIDKTISKALSHYYYAQARRRHIQANRQAKASRRAEGWQGHRREQGTHRREQWPILRRAKKARVLRRDKRPKPQAKLRQPPTQQN